ncbi:MAG: hypothetical protein QOG92_1166 [Verrucomicrobiota bacterium]|nr:hypothetical protein [Verrucomicrobiota bacterium]
MRSSLRDRYEICDDLRPEGYESIAQALAWVSFFYGNRPEGAAECNAKKRFSTPANALRFLRPYRARRNKTTHPG